MAAAPLLEVRELHAWYGAAQALFGVNLHVHRGEAVSLLGRNGMGKSTTIKAVMGMLPRVQGEVVIQGRPSVGRPAHRVARDGLGLVPEGRQVFATLTVEENLLATARPGPWDLARVHALFPRLAERRTQPGSQLSGGEQQMLAIARALMTNPALLILDEATEGLAPLVRAEIWKVVDTLRSGGESILIVDKNVGRLKSLCDRHVVLERGRTVWQGTSQALERDLEQVSRHLSV